MCGEGIVMMVLSPRLDPFFVEKENLLKVIHQNAGDQD
jgi:hypothetical protein